MKARLETNEFKRMVSAVEYAADTGAHHREGYNAIHLRINDEHLDIFATDGFRLAWEDVTVECDGEAPVIGIEAKALRKVATACAKGRAHELIDLEASDDELHLVVNDEEHRLPIIARMDTLSKFLDTGTFQFTAPTAELNPEAIIAAVGKRDKDAWLRIFATERSGVAAGWMVIGEPREKSTTHFMDVANVGPIVRFEPEHSTWADVNARWFIDALKATKRASYCELSIDKHKGVRINNGEGGLHIIMPMQNKETR